jgi:diaminopropionate ammonia-lyase
MSSDAGKPWSNWLGCSIRRAIVPEVIENTAATSQAPIVAPPALKSFHTSLPGYQPTSVVSMPDLAAELGVGHVLLKDETSRLGLPSFKIAGASWAVAAGIQHHLAMEALPGSLDLPQLRQAVLRTGIILAAATDGNHGRAIAHMAALLDLPCRIFVPDDLAEDRIAAIISEGATVERVKADYDTTVARAASWAAENPDVIYIQDTAWEGYEYLPQQVVLGYDTILRELDEELAARELGAPDLLLAQMGVGSFASAVIAHYGSGAGRPRFVGVEPESAACVAESVRTGTLTTVPGPHPSIMAGLNCGSTSELAWPILQAGLNACVTISDDQAREGMRYLAGQEVAAGECSGGAIGGIRTLLQGDDASLWREHLGLTPLSVVILFATEGVTEPSSYASIVGDEVAGRLIAR